MVDLAARLRTRFNTEIPELAFLKTGPPHFAAQRRDSLHSDENKKRMKLCFLNENLEEFWELDQLFTNLQLIPKDFQWVGNGRCCVGLQTRLSHHEEFDQPEISYQLLDLKRKRISTIDMDPRGCEEFDSNLIPGMIFGSPNCVLFSLRFKSTNFSFVLSEKMQVVDLREATLPNA